MVNCKYPYLHTRIQLQVSFAKESDAIQGCLNTSVDLNKNLQICNSDPSSRSGISFQEFSPRRTLDTQYRNYPSFCKAVFLASALMGCNEANTEISA